MTDKTISSYFEVGENIKARRKELGLKQEELANLTGIGLRTIQSYENNEVNQKISTLKQIASALDCNFEKFLNKPKDYDQLREMAKKYLKIRTLLFPNKLKKYSKRLSKTSKEIDTLANKLEKLKESIEVLNV